MFAALAFGLCSREWIGAAPDAATALPACCCSLSRRIWALSGAGLIYDGVDGPCNPASMCHDGLGVDPLKRSRPYASSHCWPRHRQERFPGHVADSEGRRCAQVRLRRARRCLIIFACSRCPLSAWRHARLPPFAREVLMLLVDGLATVWRRIEVLKKKLVALHRTDEISRRLASIPGVEPITDMAIAAVPDPSIFRSGREFAANGSG